ncbi:hypothetical protein RRF57_005512 [Xylaria bambusicola]|uniref:Uncharacterized protein n=1 Tax=Xylaria bambusicola TaxID=326684 RepID=A0AAN7Z639_9PEZI
MTRYEKRTKFDGWGRRLKRRPLKRKKRKRRLRKKTKEKKMMKRKGKRTWETKKTLIWTRWMRTKKLRRRRRRRRLRLTIRIWLRRHCFRWVQHRQRGWVCESEDEDDGELQLWTPSTGLAIRLSNDSLICRRPSLIGEKSDSSSSEGTNIAKRIRQRGRRIKFRPGTPELPDSTDFVCGTLDEDRDLENAYISCLAVKRREKLHPIPQDIDPSFPTSEPEDEDIKSRRRGHDSDEQLWIHGEPEDIHHTRDQDGERRKKKPGHISPKRYRSPPPKARGRSPRRLFDRHSPRRLVSPPPLGRANMMRSPPASLVHGGQCDNAQLKTLAFRPGLTHTKSLPRAPALFPPHIKNQRRMSKALESGAHVRGAIDIVKGLEQKRQRRKEKFKEKYLQKHTNKARKGQLPQQRPQPGKGAERMREIGLLSAGKLDPDQYVLSI